MSSPAAIRWREQAEEAPSLLPAEAETHANLPAENLAVVCPQLLCEDLQAYFGEERRVERLSLLLGRVWRRREGAAVVLCVSGYRNVPVADSSAVHVRMAPLDWPGVWAATDGRQIVGWAHSHPGHGVRPSATDLATQRRWFAQPWALAIIADPCAGTMAAYAGRGCTPVTLVRDAELTALLS